jgi:hypothetical protein
MPPITEPMESLQYDIANKNGWNSLILTDKKEQHFEIMQLSKKCDTLDITPEYHLVKVIRIGQNYYKVNGESVTYIGSTHLKY